MFPHGLDESVSACGIATLYCLLRCAVEPGLCALGRPNTQVLIVFAQFNRNFCTCCVCGFHWSFSRLLASLIVGGSEMTVDVCVQPCEQVIHTGGVGSGFKNVDEADYYDEDGVRLFHIKATNEYNIRAIQVKERASSLNSGDCFVLETPKTLYLWFGTVTFCVRVPACNVSVQGIVGCCMTCRTRSIGLGCAHAHVVLLNFSSNDSSPLVSSFCVVR